MINPWTILIFVSAVLGGFGSGYFKGSKDENAKQQAEIARLNNESRIKEQALVTAVNTQATTLRKQQDEAKISIQKRNADITSGNLKLRIPIKTSMCAVQPTADAAPASGTDSGYAELQPAVATRILAIGDDADNTARKLATCINLYNEAREALKGKP
ncbi:phage lambda Rz-like lysis protein [uncultured Caudovirales phage]|uniref:Phage lambda Rz-like lysis protein n=1 Tax=uncultured Caudovirales phage TaxID=2100421 RepID=A0A6J5LEC8_9CAUD|nr:phage lambda Rz-like lysis protein [uncultured Caudovirales phage]